MCIVSIPTGYSYSVGSLHRKGIKATEDGETVALLKSAGGIPLLVSNTPEFCTSWESSNLVTGRTLNPYDTRHSSGGSSGGEVSILDFQIEFKFKSQLQYIKMNISHIYSGSSCWMWCIAIWDWLWYSRLDTRSSTFQRNIWPQTNRWPTFGCKSFPVLDRRMLFHLFGCGSDDKICERFADTVNTLLYV